MTKLFQYVGDSQALSRVGVEPAAAPVRNQNNLVEILREFERKEVQYAEEMCTFIVDSCGALRIAARRSEHVVCAGGEPVQAAGEIRFGFREPNQVIVEYVSNQSTGYCPDLTSWHAVESALLGVGIEPPARFTHEFVFRRCEICGERTLVKEDWFECVHCEADLPKEYNF